MINVFTFFQQPIIILTVIVITINHYDQKNEIYWQMFSTSITRQ